MRGLQVLDRADGKRIDRKAADGGAVLGGGTVEITVLGETVGCFGIGLRVLDELLDAGLLGLCQQPGFVHCLDNRSDRRGLVGDDRRGRRGGATGGIIDDLDQIIATGDGSGHRRARDGGGTGGHGLVHSGKEALHGDIVGREDQKLLKVGLCGGQITAVASAKSLGHETNLGLGLALGEELAGWHGQRKQHRGRKEQERLLRELGVVHLGDKGRR